jgi:voltage-gated potassium channel
LSLAFVSFVAAAVAGIASPLFFAVLLSACVVIAVMRTLFPPGRLFPIAFASLLAVYAAIFSLFVEETFRGIGDTVLVIGFCLPIAFFVIGCGLRRDQIRTLVARPTIRSEQRVLRAAAWLVPVFLIGATVVVLSHAFGPFLNLDMVFLGAMALIGVIVLSVSGDVAIFLVDAGLLFKEFFLRVSRLVIPAFAFVTFYSLIVILFASAYRLISVYTSQPHFKVAEALRGLSFSEAIYMCGRKTNTLGCAPRRKPFAGSSWTCGASFWVCASDTSFSPRPSGERSVSPRRLKSAC